VLGNWVFDDGELNSKESTDTYWKKKDEKQDDALILGDFNSLVTFLVANSGRISDIDGVVNEN
jgi:hypothetical protein